MKITFRPVCAVLITLAVIGSALGTVGAVPAHAQYYWHHHRYYHRAPYYYHHHRYYRYY